MLNKFPVFMRNTNTNKNEKKTIFRLPSKKDLKERWLRFLNRKDLKPD